VWGFMICGTTHTHTSPLLLHLLLNSSCLPFASPSELSARWVLSSSHQIPKKRSLLYGSGTQGSPQRDRDRKTERTRLGFGHRSRKRRLRAAAVAAIVHVACVLTTGAWIFFVVRACVRECLRGVCFLRR
jgi:hypothetical protein